MSAGSISARSVPSYRASCARRSGRTARSSRATCARRTSTRRRRRRATWRSSCASRSSTATSPPKRWSMSTSAQSPRAFCAVPRIPDEVYLVISPQGGEYDYGAMFHEGGHAQHFAHTDATLPFALRGLGDNSVTEGFAFVVEHIMASPEWLEQYVFMHDPTDYLAMQRFSRLYMFRRYAAKLLYESELHAAADVRGRQKRYADLLTAATGVRYAPEDYLADVDDAYYAARYDAPALLAQMGLGGLDIAPLMRELLDSAA